MYISVLPFQGREWRYGSLKLNFRTENKQPSRVQVKMSVFYKPYLIACTVADGKCGIDAHNGPDHSKSSCRA